MDENYDKLKMKNDQPHTEERKYVTIKIRKCSEMLDGGEEFPPETKEGYAEEERRRIARRGRKCKSDAEITELLNSLVFTYYMATGVA